MGTQFVESLHDSAFHRSAFGSSRQDEGHFLARRDRNSRRGCPSDTEPRTPYVAIDWLSIQFIKSEQVKISQKSSVLRSE
jgi:hypothetical protein